MQASACGALLPLVKYAATGSIDALLSVGILPLLVRLLLFQTDKHPSQITIYACLGIVKYSDTVCQQLAKASSPKKGSVTVTLCSLVLRPYSWVFVLGKQVASSAKGTKARKGGAKARPAEGVVYNLQLPSVASPPSKRVQAQMTPTYGTNESNVLSANAFAASKPPGESNPRTTTTTRVRPSPSDPNLPSLESLQSSDMKSTAKRPSRPTRQTGSSPPKRPANPPKAAFPASPSTSPKQKQAVAASDRPLVGSPKSTQAHSVIVKQGDPAIEVAIKRPPGRSSSVGVSPRQMSVPLIVVDQAWGGPIEEDEKQTARTSPTRPVPPPPKVITPLAPSEHVGTSVFRFRRTVDTSSQAAPNGGGGSEGATADVNPTFPVNGTPSIPPPDGVSCAADTPLHPRNIEPTVDSFEPTTPCITTAAVTGRTHATRDGIVDQATPRDAALSSATEKHPSKGPVEDMTSPGQEQQQDTNTLGVISDEPPRDHTDDTTAFLEPPLQSLTPHTSTPTGDPEEADLLVDRKADLATDGSGAAKGVDPCAFVEFLAPLDASPPHDNGKALSPRRYGPMTPANTFVGAFFPPISTLDLDVVAADLMLVETVIETARRPTDRRFVPMTPANTFVGLQNTDAMNGKVPGTTCPVEFALSDDTVHDVLVSLLAAQLVRSWLYDATLSLSQSKHDQQSRSPRCDDDDNALEFCPTVATAQELPAWRATSTNHQEPPNADVQGMMAPSIEVSMLAGGQMVRGWTCDVQNRLVGDPIPLSVQWQDEEDNMDNANRRRVSESFEALPPPYVDEYDVAIARVASQLVQVWLYDTMDKLVSQATTAAPTLIVMAQLSPPDISPLCGLAMNDVCDTVSSSYSCQIHELERLEQATLGTPEFQHEAAKEAPTTAAAASDVQPTDTLQEGDEVCYEADFEGFVSTPEGVPVDMIPPVVTVPGKEIEGLDTPSTKTIEDESLVVQVSVVASQLVRAWIHTAVVSCINRIVTPPAYSGEDLLPADSLVPNLPPPLDPLEPPSTPSSPSSLVDDGFSMVSEDPKDHHLAVDVSLVAAQLVQSWIYETLDRVTTFSTRPHEHHHNHHRQQHASEDWGCDEEVETTKGATAQGDDCDEWSVASAMLAQRLVQAWMYETLARVTHVSSMSITDAAESGGAAAPLTTANDEYKEEADSQLSVAASVLAAQLVQAWIVETLQRVVRFTTRPHEHPMVPIRDRATAECHVITSLLDPLTAIHSISPSNPMAFDDGDVWNVQVSSVAPSVKAWVFEGMLNAVESLISSSSSVVFIDQGLLRHDVSDATILRPPILYFDQGTARRPESSLSDPELDGQAPVGRSVEVSLLAAQLVRGWIYFTLDDVVRFSSRRQHHDAQAATSYYVSSSPPPDTPNELASTMHAQPDDSVTAALDLEDGCEDERGVAVSFVAGQLVRLWLYETMDAIVRFSCHHHGQAAPVSTPPAIHFVEAGCFIDAVTPPVVSPESGAFVSAHRDHGEDHDVSLEVVLVANLLVRAWTSDAVLNIVDRWQADHDADPSCISSSAKEQPQLDLTTAPCHQEAETRPICLKGWTRDDNDESLEVVLLANLLVRAWTSEAILRVMYDNSFTIPVDVTTGSSTSLKSHDDHSYFPLDCPINALQVPHSDGGTPPSHTSPFSVAAAASKAVVNSTGEGETIPPLEVVLWANLLVRAWTFEAMVLVLDAAPVSMPTGQGSYPPEEVTPVVPSVLIPFPAPSFTISPATTAPRENSTDYEVSFEVVLFASLLVRAWTCDAMGRVLDAIAEAPLDPRAADSTLNQIASSCTVHASSTVTTVEGATSDVSTVSPSPDPDCLLPTALPAAATAPIGSVLDDEMSLEVVLLANLLVRAWVSDAMGRVLVAADGDDLAEQITPTTALSTTDSPTKQEILRPRPLSSQSQHVNDSIDFPTALTPLQVGPLMESVVRQCPGGSDVEQSHQVMSLEIVLLANLLVRAWVSEAVVNATLCDPQLYLLRRPPTSTDQGLLQKASAGSYQPDSTEPSRQDNGTKPLVRTTLQCGTASASDIQKSTEKTLTDQHDDMVYVLLANLLVRAWISEATGLVLDRVPTHIPSLFTTTKFNVPTDKNSVDLAIASTCSLASSSTSSTSSSLPDEADDDKHIAAIFTKWNEGECTHESCRRLEGEYLKGASSVGDWVAGYVAAPVTSAMTSVGTFQWPQIATSPHEMDVAIALLAAQMTRWWIFEALCSVSNKKLQKLLLRGDSTQHHHQRWSS
ncbi:hypothetical protein DYB36_001720 [Aphanomyces astaci]|uniref:Uncharacterized protein n=1 Tax=Aphanomyces astaci TaxID=112090 RepID=A0A397B6V5_APHAT|nr:hypothetical protein DYB36_001720 [Aphanomyces astaci]